MNWFISKIVFNISTEGQDHRAQFDEQLRLIAANSAEEAFLKARQLGLREEDTFFNSAQKEVKWEFVNVSEVIPLNRLEDGAELYSRIHETDQATSYIHDVHQKAIYLRLHQRLN